MISFSFFAHTPSTSLQYLSVKSCVSFSACFKSSSVISASFFITFNLSIASRRMERTAILLSSDILIVYPGRLTQGKKFEKVAALGGAIKKKTEKSVKIVFCDFPSLDIQPYVYKPIINKIGCLFGLDETDISFTSDLGYPNGFPRKGVLDLFTLSNLFICPSFSESFGLTVLEAASRGNFIVLNEAVPALEELGKNIKAYFMRWDARNFGFDTKENYHPSEQAYLEENGEKIINMMRENPVIHSKTMVRQRYSPKWIWENQLKPLLEK